MSVEASLYGVEDRDRIEQEVVRGFAMYGSLDKWPTLTLFPSQYPICECKCRRSQHRYRSGELLDCKTLKCKCECFRAR